MPRFPEGPLHSWNRGPTRQSSGAVTPLLLDVAPEAALEEGPPDDDDGPATDDGPPTDEPGKTPPLETWSAELAPPVDPPDVSGVLALCPDVAPEV